MTENTAPNDEHDSNSLKNASTASKSKTVKNSAGRPTHQELQRRKAKVIEVATERFVAQGYAATSLVEIAKLAGVATRTVYQHFGDKEGVFKGVMFGRSTAAVFPPPELAPNEALFKNMMRIAEYICEVTFRPNTVNLMYLAISESKRFPDMMRRLTEQTNGRFVSNIKYIFDQFVALGFFEETNTDTAAEMFIHLILGNTPLLVFAGWQSVKPTKDQLEEKVKLFILGRWGPEVAENAHKLH